MAVLWNYEAYYITDCYVYYCHILFQKFIPNPKASSLEYYMATFILRARIKCLKIIREDIG